MANITVGIAGSGHMGRAVAWAMDKLGYSLVILDQQQHCLYKCQELLPERPHRFIRAKSFKCFNNCDMVISSLPFHQNLSLARFCIANNIAYCDLGGNVQTSQSINHFGKQQSRNIIMTDLGLAPGWVNIIAEHMYQKYISKHNTTPTDIQMRVGGLPQHPQNTLKYGCTWSYDGLVNEYRDRCKVLRHGEQIMVNGMQGYEYPIYSDIGPLEGFYTSGGVSHTIDTMQRRGVLNCSYKTLRYPQHHQIVNFLIHESGLDDKSIIDIFKKTCPPQDDLVIIQVRVNDSSFEQVIRSDSQFSAMQKATGFPIASAAHTILISDVETDVLKYSDLNYPQFNKTLEQLFNTTN